jgi:hypothetical protein
MRFLGGGAISSARPSIRSAITGLAVCASFVVSLIPAQSATTLWTHNGSIVELAPDGDSRRFYYYDPRESMARAGVSAGILLFDGRTTGSRYVGTAYFFNPRCGQGSFEVSGPILDNQTRIVLEGRAPRLGDDCRPHGYFTERLEFRYLRQNAQPRAFTGSPQAYDPPASLGEVAENGDGLLPFIGIWIEVNRTDNSCNADDWYTRGKEGQYEHFTRLTKISHRSLEGWELECTIKSARKAQLSFEDRHAIEVNLQCWQEGDTWDGIELWDVKSVDGRDSLVSTSLKITNLRDANGKRMYDAAKSVTRYLRCP